MVAKKTAFGALDRNKTIAENTANSGPVLLDSNVTLTSPGADGFDNGIFSVTLANAVTSDVLTLTQTGGITLGMNGVTGETEVFYNGTQIGTLASSEQDGTTLRVFLTQGADNEAVTALARAVGYSSFSNAPPTAARAVTFSATDADSAMASASMQLKIKPENDALVVSRLGSRSSHTPSSEAGGVVIDHDAQVVNPDGTGFKGGKLTVHLDGAVATDQLYLAGGPFSITGNKLYLNGTQVGTVSGNGAGGRNLAITFKGNAAISDAQMSALVEQVSYRSTAASPPATREVTFTITDAEKSALSTHVTLAFENQAPIFLSESPAGGITLVSALAGGEHGNGESFAPDISESGFEVAFGSDAANFSDSATTYKYQIFIKNLSTGAITLVSANASGAEGNENTPGFYDTPDVSISPDGHQVLFVSTASNLVPGDTNGSEDVFMKDLDTGAIVRVSTDSSGAQINAASARPSFSPDGTKFVFASGGVNPAGDPNRSGLYIKDLVTGDLIEVAINDESAPFYATEGGNPTFSPDGTRIAFVAFGNDRGPNLLGGSQCIYVKDLTTGDVTYVSAASAHEVRPVFSPDGTKIAFVSAQNSVVPGGANSGTQLYVKDLVTGEVTCASTQGEIQPRSIGDTFSFSADGTKIVFSSTTDAHVGEHGNGIPDIFVADLQTGTVTLVTTNANGASTSPVFAPDGAHVIFASDASNLVSGDNNKASDIFMASLETASATTATLTEDAARNTLNTAGTIYFSDADTADTHTVSVEAPADALGTLSAKVVSDMNGTGAVVWSYAVDEAKVEPLAAGETRVETFILDLSDGHGGTVAQAVTITLAGTGEGEAAPQVAAFALAGTHAPHVTADDAGIWTFSADAFSTGGDLAGAGLADELAARLPAPLVELADVLWTCLSGSGGGVTTTHPLDLMHGVDDLAGRLRSVLQTDHDTGHSAT